MIQTHQVPLNGMYRVSFCEAATQLSLVRLYQATVSKVVDRKILHFWQVETALGTAPYESNIKNPAKVCRKHYSQSL